MTRRVVRRALACAALVAAVVVVTAPAAGAHAALVSVDPQEGGVYDASPDAVTLRFNEPVEIALGGVRVFDGDGDRVDTGEAEHPDGRGTEVRADLPELDDGTYVVTWRVTSADAHPIEGAFTFQVGPEATAGNARGLAARLLSEQGGSSAVGVLYAIDRGLVFASLALLIGGVVFVLAVFPAGRRLRRAGRLVWTGWALAVVATVAGIGLEGAYVAALDLADALDPSVWSDVLDTRYGRVALVRLALLAVAMPLLVLLLRRERVAKWLPVPAALVGIALAATPGIAGHASTGDHVALALVSDTLHVLAMSCWLGGLVMLVALVLGRLLPAPPQRLRDAINRFSALALGAVAVLVVTGGFQSWRQVGSLDALRDTDFGRILLVKLVVFAAMVVAAAFSREIVNRRFREPLAVSDADADADADAGAGAAPSTNRSPVRAEPVLVGATVGGRGRGWGEPPAVERGDAALADDDADEAEARRLKRSVLVELVFAVAILAVTAVLVNTAPARTESTEPVELSMRSGSVFADVTIAPAVAGPNDIHVTVLPSGSQPVTDLQMQLTRPGSDLAPFDVPLRPLGPNHVYAPRYNIPFTGEWKMVLRVQLGTSDEAVLTDDFTIR